MFEWITANLGTILVAAILILVVSLVIAKLIKDKRQGKSSCGGNCAGCAMSGSCHKEK